MSQASVAEAVSLSNKMKVVKFQNNHHVWNLVHGSLAAFSVIEEYTEFFLIKIPESEWPLLERSLPVDLWYGD